MTEVRLEHLISHHIGMKKPGHGAQNILFCGHQLVGPASACNLLAKPASQISQAVQHCTMRRTAAEGCTASPADCWPEHGKLFRLVVYLLRVLINSPKPCSRAAAGPHTISRLFPGARAADLIISTGCQALCSSSGSNAVHAIFGDTFSRRNRGIALIGALQLARNSLCKCRCIATLALDANSTPHE